MNLVEDLTVLQQTSIDNVASINLLGPPYTRVHNGERVDLTEAMEQLARNSDYKARLECSILTHDIDLQPLFNKGYHGLDSQIKDPTRNLTFEEAYSALALVICSTNNSVYEKLAARVRGNEYGLMDKETLRLHAVSILQGMSVRENLIGLSPEEIAGMIAAVTTLDTVTRPEIGEQTFAIGGMGGDKGFTFEGKQAKFFSISTTAAIGLANYGLVHKHDSYPNTSKVAGQTARESLGARSDFRTQTAMTNTLLNSGFLGSSCHSTRTVHTLSHKLKGETVNHVIGPAAFPQSENDILNAVIGVNHNVHPETYLKALDILDKKGIQRFGNSVAFCGLNAVPGQLSDQTLLDLTNADNYYKRHDLKNLVIFDEVMPPPYLTLAAFKTERGVNTVVLKPEDFMYEADVQSLSLDKLIVKNETQAILDANNNVFAGVDREKVMLISMTIALSIFARDFAHLTEAFNGNNINKDLLRAIYYSVVSDQFNGAASNVLNKYILNSNNIR